MAIAYDNSATSTSSPSGNLQFALTVGSGANRILLAGGGIQDGAGAKHIDAITYNGTGLNKIVESNGSSQETVSLWSLVPPDSGSHDVIITYSSTGSDDSEGGAVAFSGVDQTTSSEASAAVKTSGNVANITITTLSTNAVIVDMMAQYAFGTQSATSLQTDWTSGGVGVYIKFTSGYKTISSASATNMSWYCDGIAGPQGHDHVIVSLVAASGTTSSNLGIMTLFTDSWGAL